MEPNVRSLIALVNLFTTSLAGYPNPEDPDPPGPWGPWIREALAAGPLPDPWVRQGRAAADDDDWWKDVHPGPRPHWLVAVLAGLAGLYLDELNPGRPKPNWAALFRPVTVLNPQPLPPVDPGVIFALNLASVVLRRARGAGGDAGAGLVRSFAEDWCGNGVIVPEVRWPGGGGGPRPPRPEESLVLGARLAGASAGIADTALKAAVDEAGTRIFRHGLSGHAG